MKLLLDSALLATVILFVAWVASLLLHRASAGVRHAIWLAAILALAALPAILSIPQSAIPTSVRFVVPAIAAAQFAPRQIPWLFIAWAVGASLILARLAVGIFAVWRMRGNLYSDSAATPMTWGFIRPVLILPAYMKDWSEADRDLMVRHEQAHIARRDWLSQTFASLMTAAFWFHPLMWLASMQLRREAEGAADDLVLRAGAEPCDYAERLVDVARRLNGYATPSMAIPMVRKPELEMRVRSILDPSRNRGRAGLLVRFVLACAALIMIMPVAVTRVHAQGQVYKVGDGVSQPSILYKSEPEYTREAEDAKIQGTVRLKVDIDIDGRARDILVTKALGYGLDQKAIEAVERWRFKPGMKDGDPVPVYATIEVTFRLK